MEAAGDPISSNRIRTRKIWPHRINTDEDGVYIAKRKEQINYDV